MNTIRVLRPWYQNELVTKKAATILGYLARYGTRMAPRNRMSLAQFSQFLATLAETADAVPLRFFHPDTTARGELGGLAGRQVT